MDIAYERAYAYYNRIMERIETTEGYQPGDAFALVGEYGLSETPDLLGSYSMDGERFEDLSGVARETGLLTSGVRHNFMKIYIGVEMPDVSLIFRKYQKSVIHVVILKQTDSDTFRSMSSMNYAASIERKENTYKKPSTRPW